MIGIDFLSIGGVPVKPVLATLCSFFLGAVSIAHANPAYSPPGGWPQQIDVPKIAVHATVDPLRLDRLGPIDKTPPWAQVAWWDAGPKPGDKGIAQLYGHLDSYTGPAVFWHLDRLAPGDVIRISYRHSAMLTFRVMWSRSYADNQIPENWMLSARGTRAIALITCGGAFHGLQNGGYDHKLLVYARLVLPNGTLG
jgi:hypothetical protein